MALSNSTDRFNGVLSTLAIKAPCVAVAVANITLSGEQTVNGVAVVSGDRVLVTAQTSAVDNGIYDVSSAAWTRSADFDGNRDVVRGTLVTVNASTGQDFFYQVTTADPITIGNSAITFLLTNDPNVSYPLTAAEITFGLTADDINDSFVPENVKRHGAILDGAADDILAIQQAVDVLKGSIGPIHGTIVLGGDILFPRGTALISVPIKTYSGINLGGEGPVSKIKSSSGFVGPDLITLTEVGSGAGNRVSGAWVHDLEFDSQATAGTQAGIGASTTASFLNINNRFTNLIFNTEKCLDFPVDCQSNIIDNIYSYGPVDQIIRLSGNRNVISNIDKEVGSGSSSDPYIFLDDLGGAGFCVDNVLENILLEGTGNANKVPIKIDSCQDTLLDNIFIELTATNGNGIELLNCLGTTRISGRYVLNTTTEKISVVNCNSVDIEYLDADAGGLTLWDSLTVDTLSNVSIAKLVSRKGDNFDLEFPNVRIGVDVLNQGLVEADAGKINQSVYSNMSGNLLPNPSFEAGRYSWIFSTVPDTTEEYIDSEIGDGLMGHFIWSLASNHRLYQQIDVPTEWLGQAMTVTAKIKITGGTVADFVTVRIGNTGITENTQYWPRVSGRTSNWQALSFIFEHQSLSAVAQIGFRIQMAAGVDLKMDEVSFHFGNEGIPNLSNMRSIQMNDRLITTGTAAPITGTHVSGSMLFNESASASVGGGWRCTAAGSPGTWDPLAMSPRATTSELQDVGDAINTALDKRQGFPVFDTTANIPMYATGAANNSTWVGEKAGSTITLTPV